MFPVPFMVCGRDGLKLFLMLTQALVQSKLLCLQIARWWEGGRGRERGRGIRGGGVGCSPGGISRGGRGIAGDLGIGRSTGGRKGVGIHRDIIVCWSRGWW